MILCLDCGNSRLKWGLRGPDSWLGLGALSHGEVGQLKACLGGLPAPERIVAANVAGAAMAAAIEAACAAWPGRLAFARPESHRCGVVNGYREPARLGVDRWCALIGARGRTSAPCLVVGAGTATTIDTLDGGGRFLGGFILPGFLLMQKSLALNTANLPLGDGRLALYPTCTADAIYSGCLEAQAGAIERAYARIADQPGVRCLVFGGAAPHLANALAIPWEPAETLVLEGLYRLALEAGLGA